MFPFTNRFFKRVPGIFYISTEFFFFWAWGVQSKTVWHPWHHAARHDPARPSAPAPLVPSAPPVPLAPAAESQEVARNESLETEMEPLGAENGWVFLRGFKGGASIKGYMRIL